jgi:hypothetical protein
VVLGVESVPDGLAAGLLAGVSPLSGLYAYMFATAWISDNQQAAGTDTPG